jgi:hypothetical protein
MTQSHTAACWELENWLLRHKKDGATERNTRKEESCCDLNLSLYMYVHRCFDTWTPAWLYHQSREVYERAGRKSPYYPTFYGEMKGLFMSDESGGTKPYLSYDMTSKFTHQSLVTLEFEADSVSFIESR